MNPAIKLFNDLITKGIEYFGRYYSSYRGFVVSKEDPEGFGRLKLKVPQVYGTQTMEYWAWQKGCYSGKGYGFQLLPEKGDMVYVEFEQGDPKRPIWTYGHFGRDIDGNKEKPEELKDPNLIWFKLPDGTLFKFDGSAEVMELAIKDNEKVEPAVLGDTLESTLNELITAINSLTVSTAMGPSGPPINIADFQKIAQKLDSIKSTRFKHN